MTDAFVPTHRVPAGGLPAWDEPDGTRAPVAQLDPGLDLQVLSGTDAWVQVRFSNGWTAWVDGSRLQPLAPPMAQTAPSPPFAHTPRSPPSASSPRRWPLVVALLVLCGGIAVLAVVLLSGDDDGGGTSEVQVALVVPEGWTASEDGMVAAEQAADLTADAPTGARVSATVLVGDDDVFPEVEEALESEATLEEEPTVVDVSGVQAFTVTLQEDGYVRRYVVARRPEQDAVMFTLEAPADQWPEVQELLASVPGLGQ